MQTHLIPEAFTKWMEKVFAVPIPEEVVAFNVNLYDEPFSADIVGSCEFDEDDSDWACEETWAPEARFEFPPELQIHPWAKRHAMARQMLVEFLESDGPAARVMKSVKAVSIGFVDGDLDVVYRRAV